MTDYEKEFDWLIVKVKPIVAEVLLTQRGLTMAVFAKTVQACTVKCVIQMVEKDMPFEEFNTKARLWLLERTMRQREDFRPFGR